MLKSVPLIVANRHNSNIIGKAMVWVSLFKYNAKSIG